MSPPMKYGKFESTGNGLTYLSHPRVSPAAIIAALGLDPLRVSKQPATKYRKSWWEAQIRLYGLKCTKWTIDGMKKVLTEAVGDGLEVSTEMNALEEKLNREYLSTDKENLQPIPEPESKVNSEPTTKSKSSFALALRKLSDAARERQLEKMNRLHDELLSQSGLGDDISGTWQIDCPGIVQTWCHNERLKDSECIWKIPRPDPTDECIWLRFEQIVVEGVMCMEWNADWEGRKLEFAYRGKETGEGDVQCDDEWNRGWIMFTSTGECHGEFGCQMFSKPYKFEGKKISGHRPMRANKGLEKKFLQYEREWSQQSNVWFF